MAIRTRDAYHSRCTTATRRATIATTILAVLAAGLILGGCATADHRYTSRTGDTAVASRPLPVTISFETTRDGDAGNEERAYLTSPLTPSLTFVGDAVAEKDGSIVLYLTGLRIFTNWANGWTEGRYEASGNLKLEPTRGAQAEAGPTPAYTVTVTDPPALWSVVEGEVRYYDTYYRGDDGVAKVRARVDRLQELSRLLRDDFDLAPVYWTRRRGSAEELSFHGAVFPLLFPELAGDNVAATLPAAVDTRPGELLNGETVVGSDIAWSIDYTEAVFPENFRALRNSGTLFRDYEEAFELFYSFYNLPYLTTELSGTVVQLE